MSTSSNEEGMVLRLVAKIYAQKDWHVLTTDERDMVKLLEEMNLLQPAKNGYVGKETNPIKDEYPNQCHLSHVTRMTDSSTSDEICIHCGARDSVPGGWGKLRFPCTAVPVASDVVQSEQVT